MTPPTSMIMVWSQMILDGKNRKEMVRMMKRYLLVILVLLLFATTSQAIEMEKVMMIQLGPSAYISSVSWLPNGEVISTVVYYPFRNDTFFQFFDLNGRLVNEVEVKHHVGLSPVAFSPDGKELVYSSWDAVWIVNLETKTERRIASGKEIFHPTFSSDGKLVAYSVDLPSSKGGGIYVVDIKTKKKAKISETGSFISSPHLINDRAYVVGRVLYLSDKSLLEGNVSAESILLPGVPLSAKGNKIILNTKEGLKIVRIPKKGVKIRVEKVDKEMLKELNFNPNLGRRKGVLTIDDIEESLRGVKEEVIRPIETIPLFLRGKLKERYTQTLGGPNFRTGGTKGHAGWWFEGWTLSPDGRKLAAIQGYGPDDIGIIIVFLK